MTAQSDLVLFEAAARAAHEANRAWCLSRGDVSQVSWDEASDDIKQSCMQGVKQVFAGATPASLHDSWMKNRIEHGWVYGPVKDVEKKIHPCIVPYGELPQEQRAKDEIFLRVVTAFFQAGGLTSLAAAAFPDSMPRRLHRAKRAVVALSAGIKNVLTDNSPEIRRALRWLVGEALMIGWSRRAREAEEASQKAALQRRRFEEWLRTRPPEEQKAIREAERVKEERAERKTRIFLLVCGLVIVLILLNEVLR